MDKIYQLKIKYLYHNKTKNKIRQFVAAIIIYLEIKTDELMQPQQVYSFLKC